MLILGDEDGARVLAIGSRHSALSCKELYHPTLGLHAVRRVSLGDQLNFDSLRHDQKSKLTTAPRSDDF